MCTALSFFARDHYFGRNLDLDCSYGESVCALARRYPLKFRKKADISEHYAIVGMATVAEDTPLFYDAANEHGLAMAGLNFPGNAYYPEERAGADNITPFEFIPWILGQCKDVGEALALLERINLVNIGFSDVLPLSPLHWIISDRARSITVESMKDGLHIHENPVGVLTNNPPFEYHMFNLNNYRNLNTGNGENGFSSYIPLENYCQGLGAVGLPGDVSSMSRFVRMAFESQNSVCDGDEASAVGQFFHLLSSVEMVRGVCKTGSGKLDITVYSSCINTDRGLYYYTTYKNRQISCIDMYKTDIDGCRFSSYPLRDEENIFMQNQV